MNWKAIIRHALFVGLVCGPGLADATVLQATVKAFGPEDEVRLDSSARAALEVTACFEWAAARREFVVAYRVPENRSLLAYVRCHGIRDSEGQFPVNVIRCRQTVAKVAWQCEHHNSNYRIDYGKYYVLAADSDMAVDVPGESPDRSAEAVAAILASEPQRLNGKTCEMPRYLEGAFEIECEGVYYIVKRTCDRQACRRTVQRTSPTILRLQTRD
jgi:hypothetical protein